VNVAVQNFGKIRNVWASGREYDDQSQALTATLITIQMR
jgi:hypothetical protein